MNIENKTPAPTFRKYWNIKLEIVQELDLEPENAAIHGLGIIEVEPEFLPFFNAESQTFQMLAVERKFACNHGLYFVNLPEGEEPDVLKLPFLAGFGPEGTYGKSDKKLADQQDIYLKRHNLISVLLVVTIVLLACVAFAAKWWQS